METLASSSGQPETKPNRPLNCTVGDEPLSNEEKRGAVSKAAVESREAAHDPIVTQPMGVDLDEEDLVSQITIWRNAPSFTTENQDPILPEVAGTTGVEDPVTDIVEDVKLYQDVAIEYCILPTKS